LKCYPAARLLTVSFLAVNTSPVSFSYGRKTGSPPEGNNDRSPSLRGTQDRSPSLRGTHDRSPSLRGYMTGLLPFRRQPTGLFPSGTDDRSPPKGMTGLRSEDGIYRGMIGSRMCDGASAVWKIVCRAVSMRVPVPMSSPV